MTDTTIAIIGGTGLTSLNGLEITRREVMHTPFGEPSGPLTFGRLSGHDVVFLARHGYRHTIPPHCVNYRANLWALHHAGVERVIAVAAVGGITPEMRPCRIVFPDQIVDYTWSRSHTFFEEDLTHVTHIDFTEPYCQALREVFIASARDIGLDAVEQATYAATQGPRLESRAEINRLERDGCDLVGMTGMPETALARELGLCYATCAVVANWAAGRGEGEITMEEVGENVTKAMTDVRALLETVIPRL
ncbi:S-methyl-5'-thioinosine phosphorylase [Thiorhodospira sibirica]|uniref:S-methyl-5'-thioinosine phosphorylase n=1 Tax=Thiorhodospira sibirica TaxID=154347 RepID=UPI00022C22A6|nr:S-methyl-5'-thioinosine phosphorylase [Thiorhodospira sibirica]